MPVNTVVVSAQVSDATKRQLDANSTASRKVRDMPPKLPPIYQAYTLGGYNYGNSTWTTKFES
jgi:hypothetical protein